MRSLQSGRSPRLEGLAPRSRFISFSVRSRASRTLHWTLLSGTFINRLSRKLLAFPMRPNAHGWRQYLADVEGWAVATLERTRRADRRD
mmetsp:Transcript_32976/g.97222  ORF Transcript_32976/g.97222 Transcript_32976/m.97222 type:complete len:89 (+) Transcript_32976:128-394(+)